MRLVGGPQPSATGGGKRPPGPPRKTTYKNTWLDARHQHQGSAYCAWWIAICYSLTKERERECVCRNVSVSICIGLCVCVGVSWRVVRDEAGGGPGRAWLDPGWHRHTRHHHHPTKKQRLGQLVRELLNICELREALLLEDSSVPCSKEHHACAT